MEVINMATYIKKGDRIKGEKIKCESRKISRHTQLINLADTKHNKLI